MELKYTSSKPEFSNSRKVSDVWKSLIEQTKRNKSLLEEEFGTKFTSFAVMRIGIYVLIHEKLE